MTRTGASEMKRRIVLIWPWRPQHARTHETFPIGLGYLANNIDPRRFDVAIQDCRAGRSSPGRRCLSRSPLGNPAGHRWHQLLEPERSRDREDDSSRQVFGPAERPLPRRAARNRSGRGPHPRPRRSITFFTAKRKSASGSSSRRSRIARASRRHGSRPDPRPDLPQYRAPGQEGTASSRLPDLDALGAIDYRRLRLKE